ncbi:restriction endonuclease [Halobacteriaceae archaeon SHR40]|uniref:restriction endonuclease n=1 Tax=Halovenus amylolytica TaxID=2500550 RepID=UPI000FE31217
MGGIIDLTDGSKHEVLTTTGSSGLLGDTYLDGDPLESYLQGDEQPKYALRNKKSGLQIEAGDEMRSLEPDDDYQTLAMVTDLRILFVAGQSGGDRMLAVDLSEVVEARVGSGRFRTSTLTVETLADEIWAFPCRGDPSPVATYIEEAAQIWANAGRLLDELEEALTEARGALDDGNHDVADDQIASGEETIKTARNRIAELGTAARNRIDERAETLWRQLVDIEREVRAAGAAREHARAQDNWRVDDYETAAAAYDLAIEGYEKALVIDGSNPTDSALTARLRGARNEREILKVAPLVDADSKRRHAHAVADPEEAAKEWGQAHEGYRELLGIDWPSAERGFVADRELIREQTVEIVDDAISDHMEAGRRWLESGDKLAVQERAHQSEQVYERAKHQYEQAHQLARELRPGQVDAIEAGIDATSSRLDGEVPTDRVPDNPISYDPTEPVDNEAETSPEVDATEHDGIEGLDFHNSSASDSEPMPGTHSTASESHSRRSASSPARDERSETSVLDSIQAQKRTDGQPFGGDDEGVPATDASPADEQDTDAVPSDGTSAPDDRTATDSEAAPSAEPAETLEQQLASLDRKQLADLVAAVWQAEGWMTTVFTGASDTVYDVVAIKNEPDRRQLIWADTGGGDIPGTQFKQCAATLESSQADSAVVVTATAPSSAAKHRAENHDLTLVGAPAFGEQVRQSGLQSRLVEMAEGESPQA